MKPAEVMGLIKDKQGESGGFPIRRSARTLAALHGVGQVSSVRMPSREASASTDRAFVVSRRFKRATCS